MITDRSDWVKSKNELVEAIKSLGFPEELGNEMAKNLGSPKAMSRMISYLYNVKPTKVELVVDEMLAICSEVAAWKEKKASEEANAKYNEYCRYMENNRKGYDRDTLNAVEEEDIMEKFIFRNIREDEIDQAIAIEEICFPPNEACSANDIRERILAAPKLFLVAEDKGTGKVAGFLTGLSTNEFTFRDEFFTDASLYDPDGKNIMLLGLDVLLEYRRQGLGRELMYQYLRRERDNGRKLVILTCLKSKVKMYGKWGFCDRGISASTWGDEEWYEMSYVL